MSTYCRSSESQGIATTASLSDNPIPQEGNTGSSPPKTNEGEKSLQKDLHIDLQWSDQHSNYYCKVVFVFQLI